MTAAATLAQLASSGALSADISGSVGVGITPISAFTFEAAGVVSNANAGGTICATDTTSFAIGVGGRLLFRGKYNTAGNYAEYAAIQGVKNNATDGDFTGAMLFSTRNNGSGSFSERMRLDGSGNLLVGATIQRSAAKFGIDFNPSANAGIVMYPTTNVGYDAARFLNNASTQIGSIVCTTTGTSYVTTSDYRLKENVQPMTGALTAVAKLKPVTYTWKSDGSDGQGFIAHELQAIVPDAVVGEKDAVDEDGNIKPQGIDTSFLVATLTAALQELKAELDVCKAEIAALKGV